MAFVSTYSLNKPAPNGEINYCTRVDQSGFKRRGTLPTSQTQLAIDCLVDLNKERLEEIGGKLKECGWGEGWKL